MNTCGDEPIPTDPYLSIPGLALACSISSFTLPSVEEAGTISASGSVTINVTCAKSLYGSYGSCAYSPGAIAFGPNPPTNSV
jgi:hypothetical protein